jgi:hypothetical protein
VQGKEENSVVQNDIVSIFFFGRLEKKLILENNSKIKYNNIFLNKNTLKNNF